MIRRGEDLPVLPLPTTVTGGVFALLIVAAAWTAATKNETAEAMLECFMIDDYGDNMAKR
jgi:hypothetical protein